MTQNHRVTPFRPVRQPGAQPDAEPATRQIFVRALVLLADIGVYRREQGTKQRVRINLELTVEDGPATDRLKDVVNYAKIIDAVRALVARGRVNLVETLAEQVAGCCLVDRRVRRARVRVEKLDVIPEAASVGVEIERSREESA